MSKTDRMIVTRLFEAPLEVVWRAWTDPSCVVQWWGPKDFSSPACKMDFRVGGRYLFCMKAPDGQELWTGGEYHEIVPYEKIAASMYFADREGNRVEPAQYGIEHEAQDDVDDVVLFAGVGDGRTELTFIGNETMDSATKSGQVEGWKQIFDKLALVIARLVQAQRNDAVAAG